MTVHGRHLAAVAVSVGIAVATGHGVAWADPDAEHGGASASSATSATSATSSTDSGAGKPSDGTAGPRPTGPDSATTPEKPAKHPKPARPHDDSTRPATTDGGDTGQTTHDKTPADKTTADKSPADKTAANTDPEASKGTDSPTDPTPSDPPVSDPTTPSSTPTATAAEPQPPRPDSRDTTRPAKATSPKRQSDAATAGPSAPTGADGQSAATATDASNATAAAEAATVKATALPAVKTAAVATAAVVSTVSTTTTPVAPQPLSPIAQLIALPGKIINTLLQALDLTVSANGPKSPIDFTPIDEFLFAAFRRVEGALGLTTTPPAQPVATETYTGPTTAVTPTVTQFLNASAAEYVLGGTPGGLQPFTVDGVPVTSTNILTGESAQVWVTPEKQLIIAYQGTTGGTNLLFNPLIAISQLLTDAQVILTNTTPFAFTDALAFEQRVQTAAAAQGYDTGDIFLTGHSLGGWEAEYVAQQTGLSGIGFESPGINTVVPGNGNGSNFVNVETYGDAAAYFATDLPGLQPFMPAYVPGGGSKPHYGSIVMIGDPDATAPLVNASALWGTSLIGDAIFVVATLGNFFEHHLPGMQAYNLGVSPDPGVVPWLGSTMGPVLDYGDLTISQLKQAASLSGSLITA